MNQPIEIVAVDQHVLPRNETLRKYGLSMGDWIALFTSQYGCCGVCGRPFEPGKRVNIDHEHVRGWKQMPPEKRRLYVRGLLCYVCNKFVTMRGVDSDRLFRGYQYLRKWEVRIRIDEPSLRAANDMVDSAPDKPRRSRHQRTNNQPPNAAGN